MGEQTEKRKALYEQFEMALGKCHETYSIMKSTTQDYEIALAAFDRIANELQEDILNG